MKNAIRSVLDRLGLLQATRTVRQRVRRAMIDSRRAAERIDETLKREYVAQHAVRKLHLGCGNHQLQGWLNCDLNTDSTSILRMDATKPYPFDSGTFDFVFSEHMIEHVTYPEGVAMLRECYRVLRPGGRIRISTPDLVFLLNLYRNDRSELQQRYLDWAAGEFVRWAPCADPAFVINNYVRDWGHQFIHDQSTLTRALQSAGFTAIASHALRQSDQPDLRGLENEDRAPPGFIQLESFTLEAMKA